MRLFGLALVLLIVAAAAVGTARADSFAVLPGADAPNLLGRTLTGKLRRGSPPPPGTRLADRAAPVTDDELDCIETLERFAAERGVTLLDIAIGGLAAQPAGASVIAGATSAAQVRANVAAAEWQPSVGDLAALDEVAPHRRPMPRF